MTNQITFARTRLLVRLSVLGMLLVTLPLFAQTMDWSTVGSVGIIDEDSVSLYAFTAYDLEFKTGQTGTITARYPLMHTGDTTPPWGSMIVGGSGPGVTVTLIRNSKCIPSTPEPICVLGPSTASGNFCQQCDDVFWSPLDFVNNAYYFEVTLTRSSTASSPKLHMISMQ
jgi:hypothetical protein